MEGQQYFADDFRRLATDGLQSCKETEDFLNKCISCGLPVETEQAGNERQTAFLTAFKRNFFPELP